MDRIVTLADFQELTLRKEKLEIPNFGSIFVRELTAEQSMQADKRTMFQRASAEVRRNVDFDTLPDYTDIVIWTVVDENDKPIFTTKDKDMIRGLPNHITNHIIATVNILSLPAVNISPEEELQDPDPLDS